MGRIPKKVECMIGQANLRSPGKRSAPGGFYKACDSRVRSAYPGYWSAPNRLQGKLVCSVMQV